MKILNLKMKILNLNEYIEELSGLLAETLGKVGWELRDGLGYFEYKRGTKPNNNGQLTMPDSWMVLYPVLLEYTEDGDTVQTLWFKTGDRELSDESLEAIKSVLKPFKDEDYTGKDMWFNPLYPNGYWQNHTLVT